MQHAQPNCTYYSRPLVLKVQELIDAQRHGKMPAKTAWEDICAIFDKEHIGRTNVHLEVEQVMVHDKNRDGLGIDWFQAHKNGEVILKIGVSMQELEKSVAFELPPINPHKSIKMDFNRAIIAKSKGMLAPLTGQEQYCSTSTGHTTAFFRALKASCITPQKALQDRDLRLSMELVSRDQRAREALQKGWKWARIVPWQAELTWPLLADLSQKAGNASNNAASLMGELEVACQIGDYFQTTKMGFDEIVDAVGQSKPPCKDCLLNIHHSMLGHADLSMRAIISAIAGGPILAREPQ